jgi:hypothetical protein
LNPTPLWSLARPQRFPRVAKKRSPWHGYDLEKVAERVGEIYMIEVGGIFGRGRQQQRVGGRGLFCFWAVCDLGNSLASLATRLEMSPAGFAMRYKEERPLLRRTVMSLSREILNYLRASAFTRTSWKGRRKRSLPSGIGK